MPKCRLDGPDYPCRLSSCTKLINPNTCPQDSPSAVPALDLLQARDALSHQQASRQALAARLVRMSRGSRNPPAVSARPPGSRTAKRSCTSNWLANDWQGDRVVTTFAMNSSGANTLSTAIAHQADHDTVTGKRDAARISEDLAEKACAWLPSPSSATAPCAPAGIGPDENY